MLIYIIKNKINDKVYIGQTVRTLSERIEDYRKESLYYPDSRPIIRAMARYGFQNFYWEVLEDGIIDLDELDQKERQYIQEYQCLCSQNGYNVEKGGRGKGKHSEETKKKIGDAQRGEKNHRFGKCGKETYNSRPVIDLTTGKIYESACLAAKDTKLNFSHVCAVARGTRGSTGHRVFRYIDEQQNIIQPDNIPYIKDNYTKTLILPEYKKYII